MYTSTIPDGSKIWLISLQLPEGKRTFMEVDNRWIDNELLRGN